MVFLPTTPVMLGACTKHIEKAETIEESESWSLLNSGNGDGLAMFSRYSFYMWP